MTRPQADLSRQASALQLPNLTLRTKRRNTVSVTPAMGASTVAGAISTPPMLTDARMLSGATSCAATVTELSQNFCTDSSHPETQPICFCQALQTGIPCLAQDKTERPCRSRGVDAHELFVDGGSAHFGVLAAET